jgi:hypothetical protein
VVVVFEPPSNAQVGRGLVALVNNRGADEANVNGRSFPRHADQRFYVPADVAQALLALPGGFAAAPDDRTDREAKARKRRGSGPV